MNRIYTWLVIVLILSISVLNAQNTVGLLSYQPTQAFDGYNLMFPHNQPNVYLIDNCGEIVHVWEDDANWRPGNTAYLSSDGLLYKAKRDVSVVNDEIWAGGGGAILEIRDWDNNLIWDFEMNDSTQRLHHDFAITDDGTIIALAWELKTTEACIAAGRDTSTLSQGVLWPDWVFEIDPNTDAIIWEWHAWDHLVQDFDANQANFGVISEHPELIDVNYGRVDGHPDWMHGNALDYNDELGQIMLSIPYFDEIWIIDHSTSTAEAAGHTGGLSNIGGDLMYRWGNPITYQLGDSSDQQLFFQHDAHWVDDFLETNHPQYGQIAVFNNRVGPDFSNASTFFPAWEMYDWAYLVNGAGAYLPETFSETFDHPTPTDLWSTGLSSVQFLPNGNTLITSGRFGYTFELTPNDEIVWEYKTPLVAGNPATQGDTLTINNNLTFRVKRYPADFAAFDNKDLSGKGWIELMPDTNFCNTLTPLVEIIDESAFKVFPNPSNGFLTVEWDGMFYANIEIFNILGQRMDSFPKCSGGRKYIDTKQWEAGVYFVTIDGGYSRKVIVH